MEMFDDVITGDTIIDFIKFKFKELAQNTVLGNKTDDNTRMLIHNLIEAVKQERDAKETQKRLQHKENIKRIVDSYGTFLHNLPSGGYILEKSKTCNIDGNRCNFKNCCKDANINIKAAIAACKHNKDLNYDNALSVIEYDFANTDIDISVAFICDKSVMEQPSKAEIQDILTKFCQIKGIYSEKDLLLCEIAKELAYLTGTSVKVKGFFDSATIRISKYYLLKESDKDVLLNALN